MVSATAGSDAAASVTSAAGAQEKVLITGGAGFVGSQLAFSLHKAGCDLVLVDNMDGGNEDNLVFHEDLEVDGAKKIVETNLQSKLIKDDIRNETLGDHMKGVSYVFHFAAIAPLPDCQNDPMKCMAINVGGTANVLEKARKAGVKRVVFASTSAIYENNKTFPCTEQDEVAPDLIYATSKLQSELLCRAFSNAYAPFEIVCLRFFNVYGPHQDFRRKQPPLIGYLIKEFMQGGAPMLHSSGHQKRDYVYIDDVTDMCKLVMKHPSAPGEIFNIASGEAISVRDIVGMISSSLEECWKKDGEKAEKKVPVPEFREAAKFWDKYPTLFEGTYPMTIERLEKEVNKYSEGSVTKAKDVLGFEVKVTPVVGFQRTVEHALTLGLDN